MEQQQDQQIPKPFGGRLRSTYTVATMEVPHDVFNLIASKLRDAGYDHAFMDETTVDLSGVALVPSDQAAPWHLSKDRNVAVGETHYRAMDSCPKNVKCVLLGPGRVACIGSWDGKEKLMGWAPLPMVPDGLPDPYWDHLKAAPMTDNSERDE
jgi:hypothetical protein